MYEQVRKIHLQFSKNGKLSEHGVNSYTTVRQPSSEMKQAVGISYFNWRGRSNRQWRERFLTDWGNFHNKIEQKAFSIHKLNKVLVIFVIKKSLVL